MRTFYLDNPIAIIIGKIVITIMAVLALGYNVWYYYIRLDNVVSMTVRSKAWYREVQELEDYQERVCSIKTKTERECDTINGERVCKTTSIPEQKCEWETRTRLIRAWPTSGAYPEQPYWADYQISVGRYESKLERYVIKLSDDRQVWDHTVFSQANYDTYPVKGRCRVGLNWWESILWVRC